MTKENNLFHDNFSKSTKVPDCKNGSKSQAVIPSTLGG